MSDPVEPENVPTQGIAQGPAPSAAGAAGPPFNAEFFSAVFAERVGQACAAYPNSTPVVTLRLADGSEYDLCQIAVLTPHWMAAVVYRDPAVEEMDTIFLPYGTISRVTVAAEPRSQRALGFRVDHRPEVPPAT